MTTLGLIGLYVTAVYMGRMPPRRKSNQRLLATQHVVDQPADCGGGQAGLFRRFHVARSMERQKQLVASLEKSERWRKRVRQRTDEPRNALQHALRNGAEMRMEQQQFFNMINHEFRTPLA